MRQSVRWRRSCGGGRSSPTADAAVHGGADAGADWRERAWEDSISSRAVSPDIRPRLTLAPGGRSGDPRPPGSVITLTSLRLLAPLSGVVVPLDRVPDPVFAQRLVGDGVALDPTSDVLLAPCDARVVQVHRAGHAVTLACGEVEILLHVGLDTVHLGGEGFTPLVQAGNEVGAGDPLLCFDADLVARRARSLLTEMVVTSAGRVPRLLVRAGAVVAGGDALLEVESADAVRVASGPPRGDAVGSTSDAAREVRSAPVVVRAAGGLHARPAAELSAAAREFSADIRILKGDREANVRSVVSLLSLEVDREDTVVVAARGGDAVEAVQTIERLLQREPVHTEERMIVPQLAATDMFAVPPALATPVEAATAGTLAPPDDGALRGVPAAPGVAWGQVLPWRREVVVVEQRASDPDHERRALDVALAAAHVQLEGMRARLVAEADADRAAIFAAHQELLEDPELLDMVTAELHRGASAAYAWQRGYETQAARLAALRNATLAGRAADLRDVGRRVLRLLVGSDEGAHEVPAGSVIIAEDLAPSEAAAFDSAVVRGICTTLGSATSHVAILARGLRIPAVAALDPRALAVAAGTPVIVDGSAGVLRIAPDQEEIARVEARQVRDRERGAREHAAADQPAVTSDGHQVEVAANVGDVREAAHVRGAGADGVGLLRSEFLFLQRRTAPDEDEQLRAYREVVAGAGSDRLVVIRTLDVGGDKPLPYLPVGHEANPFLGERGVRLTLARPELFRTQLRAILRAAEHGRVAIMFPMVSTLGEWQAARALVERERADLGVPPVPVGIMVETSAAALMAEHFAREADFLSIGTNDLTQYTLAMDRTNARLAPFVDALHPAVLRLISQSVLGAHLHDRWVGVCGALAGDLAAVPVLLGLGVDELSVDVPLVPAVKARVRALALSACRETARMALEAPDAAAVRALVEHRHP